MPNSKKAQLSHSLWEVIELMVAAVIILLVVWMTVMVYNSFIGNPQKEAQAQNAFNAIYNTINELMATKQSFATSFVDIQLPKGYIIAFFDRDKIMDTCWSELTSEREKIENRMYRSLVKAQCAPPCMCYYKSKGGSFDFFKDNNNPDHKECRQLPTGISNIVTWYDKELKNWYIKGSEEEVFVKNINGDIVQLADYPKFEGISYSNVFIYGKCEQSEFGLKQLYLEKAELGKENQKKNIIFLTGKSYLTDLKKSVMPALLNVKQTK